MSRYMVERLRLLQSWKKYLDVLRDAVKAAAPGAEAYVFGGAVEGRLTALSDIDVLVVLEREPESALERAMVRARVREELEKRGVPHSYIFDIHVAGRDRASRILSRAKSVRVL